MRTRGVVYRTAVLLLFIGLMIFAILNGHRVERIYPQDGWQFDIVMMSEFGTTMRTEDGPVHFDNGSYAIRFDVIDHDSEVVVSGDWYGINLSTVIHLHSSRLSP